MNITKNQIDPLDLRLTIDIAAADYADDEKKRLNERRRSAELKGFRKGMAPMSLIKRIYGGQTLVESVNALLSEQLNGYIKEHSLHIIGEPLTAEEQPEIEWTDGQDFTFIFDIGLSPELDITAGPDDKLPYYEITVTDEARSAMRQNILHQYGSMQEGAAVGEDDYIVADLDNGEHSVEGAYISIRNVAEPVREQLTGLKVDDKLEIDVNAAFTNETDRAAMLKLNKDQLPGLKPEFTLTVVNIKTFVPAEENQETYDRIFGEGVVNSAEDFGAKVVERLKANYGQEASLRFERDARAYFMNKGDIQLPEDFLRRWLLHINEERLTPEDIEKEFPAFLTDFRWQLIKGRLMQQFGLKVTEQDLHQAAEDYATYQYAMYGMTEVPPEYIHQAAHGILADEQQVRQIQERVEDRKTFEALRGSVTLQTIQITEKEFRELSK